jgi:hypothetical protein
VILTPSRSSFSDALETMDDEWINDHGGDGSVTQLASRIHVLYEPVERPSPLPFHAYTTLQLSANHCALQGSPSYD